MLRHRFKIAKKKRDRNGSSYEKMMKTLLLQNQQIIIQQQNMMFVFMKQFQQNPSNTSSATPASTSANQIHLQQQQHHQQHNQQRSHLNNLQQQQQQQNFVNETLDSLQQENHLHLHMQQQQQQHSHHHHHQQQRHHNQQPLHENPSVQSHQLYSHNNAATMDAKQLQQVDSQLQENLGHYLTPAASEQDPISDKTEDEDLVALLEGDGLLHNNVLYNPQTDIGSVTPYKNHQRQQQTPSYYSSGCESLTTPRVEQQRQSTTNNISQNVVKNLADSFKSPSKPKINVQIMSGYATGSMKNSKAKIIQRMNISEFLRHVHPDNDEPLKNATQ